MNTRRIWYFHSLASFSLFSFFLYEQFMMGRTFSQHLYTAGRAFLVLAGSAALMWHSFFTFWTDAISTHAHIVSSLCFHGFLQEKLLFRHLCQHLSPRDVTFHPMLFGLQKYALPHDKNFSLRKGGPMLLGKRHARDEHHLLLLPSMNL